jgi:hypothetical protein
MRTWRSDFNWLLNFNLLKLTTLEQFDIYKFDKLTFSMFQTEIDILYILITIVSIIWKFNRSHQLQKQFKTFLNSKIRCKN